MRGRFAIVLVGCLLLMFGTAWATWQIARATAPHGVKAVTKAARFRPPVILERVQVLDHTATVTVEVPVPVIAPEQGRKGEAAWADLADTFGVDFGDPLNLTAEGRGLQPGIYALEVADSAPTLYGYRNAATLKVEGDGTTRVQILASEKTPRSNRWGWWGLTELYLGGGPVVTPAGLTGAVEGVLAQDLFRLKSWQWKGQLSASYDFDPYESGRWRVGLTFGNAHRWGRPH